MKKNTLKVGDIVKIEYLSDFSDLQNGYLHRRNGILVAIDKSDWIYPYCVEWVHCKALWSDNKIWYNSNSIVLFKPGQMVKRLKSRRNARMENRRYSND